ncbi:MAG: hypothetical protein WCV90_07485 [Candidatus Woesearchaeota archaeon]
MKRTSSFKPVNPSSRDTSSKKKTFIILGIALLALVVLGLLLFFNGSFVGKAIEYNAGLLSSPGSAGIPSLSNSTITIGDNNYLVVAANLGSKDGLTYQFSFTYDPYLFKVNGVVQGLNYFGMDLPLAVVDVKEEVIPGSPDELRQITITGALIPTKSLRDYFINLTGQQTTIVPLLLLNITPANVGVASVDFTDFTILDENNVNQINTLVDATFNVTLPIEICYNNKDDDGDTLVDCLDPDCSLQQHCKGPFDVALCKSKCIYDSPLSVEDYCNDCEGDGCYQPCVDAINSCNFNCDVLVTTCNNKVKDSNEEGVDCGGSCQVKCEITECVPKCVGKQCGEDQCGGTCGQCVLGTSCNYDGQCIKKIEQCTNTIDDDDDGNIDCLDSDCSAFVSCLTGCVDGDNTYLPYFDSPSSVYNRSSILTSSSATAYNVNGTFLSSDKELVRVRNPFYLFLGSTTKSTLVGDTLTIGVGGTNPVISTINNNVFTFNYGGQSYTYTLVQQVVNDVVKDRCWHNYSVIETYCVNATLVNSTEVNCDPGYNCKEDLYLGGYCAPVSCPVVDCINPVCIGNITSEGKKCCISDVNCDSTEVCRDNNCVPKGVSTCTPSVNKSYCKDQITLTSCDSIEDSSQDLFGFYQMVDHHCDQNGDVCQVENGVASCKRVNESCTDNLDNDGDTKIDCNDSDCVGKDACICVDSDNTYEGGLVASGGDYSVYNHNSLITSGSASGYSILTPSSTNYTAGISDTCVNASLIAEAYCSDSTHYNIGTFACEFGCENNACVDLNPCEGRVCGMNLNHYCGACSKGNMCTNGQCVVESVVDELMRCPDPDLFVQPLAKEICLSVTGCSWINNTCVSSEWFSLGGIATSCARYTESMLGESDTVNIARTDSCVAPCVFLDNAEPALDKCYIPKCINLGRTCGDDGYGGSCGTCGSTQSCLNYQCVEKCVDSDGGNSSSIKGTVTWINASGQLESKEDKCMSLTQNAVVEGRCENNTYAFKNNGCSGVCNDGQCVSCTYSSQCIGNAFCKVISNTTSVCANPDFRLDPSNFYFGGVYGTLREFGITVSGNGNPRTNVTVKVTLLNLDGTDYSSEQFNVSFGTLTRWNMSIPSATTVQTLVKVILDPLDKITETNETNNVYSFSHVETVETNCNDGSDGDADGKVDYADLDCWNTALILSSGDVNQDTLVNNDDWDLVKDNKDPFWKEVLKEDFAALNEFMWTMGVNWK